LHRPWSATVALPLSLTEGRLDEGSMHKIRSHSNGEPHDSRDLLSIVVG